MPSGRPPGIKRDERMWKEYYMEKIWLRKRYDEKIKGEVEVNLK